MASCVQSNALPRIANAALRTQLGGAATTAVRLFSSNYPPRTPEGGGQQPYRLPRPARSEGGGRGGGSDGGRGGGSGGGRGRGRDGDFRKRDSYANPNPYVPGDLGTRANAITLFPGNFQDKDDGFRGSDSSGSYDGPYVDEDPEEVKMREYMKKEEEAAEAQRQKWLENAKPVERVSEIDERGRSYGRGARKTAQARVWIQPGLGEVVVNHRPFTDYFERLTDRELVVAPFVATETCGKFDAQVSVKGGGLTGQAGAVRLGVARALNAFNPDAYRPALKILGYLTRDARKVERKLVGHVKARKSPQWVRR